MPLCESPQPELCGCEIHCGCSGTCSIHKYSPFERQEFQKVSEEDLEYLKGKPVPLKLEKPKFRWDYLLIRLGLIGIFLTVLGYILRLM